MQALHAQSAQTPAYFVANIEQVTDPQTMARYRAAADKTEAPFGGRFLARGMPQAMDSSALPKGQILLLRFPSMQALRGWWNSPAYSALRPLRERSSVGRFYAIEGLPTS
jgi:uncharacterized protein (DUF1330 family)